MKITQADALTIWMDCHPIQTNWCPHLCHRHHFYAGCPSWHNPPNLSWLVTGAKYAGLHTRWLGVRYKRLSHNYAQNTEQSSGLHNISSKFNLQSKIAKIYAKYHDWQWSLCLNLSSSVEHINPVATALNSATNDTLNHSNSIYCNVSLTFAPSHFVNRDNFQSQERDYCTILS